MSEAIAGVVFLAVAGLLVRTLLADRRSSAQAERLCVPAKGLSGLQRFQTTSGVVLLGGMGLLLLAAAIFGR